MKQQKRIYRITTAACTLSAIAAGLILWAPWPAPAQNLPTLSEIDQAREATATALASNSACPTNAVAFREMVEALWPYLHPELVNRLRANDPDYLANYLTASIQILQADQMAAEAAKDPAYLVARDAVQRAFDQMRVDPREAEDAALRQAQHVRERQEAARRQANPTGE